MNNVTLLKEMGERIYLRRKSLKLTQEELAEKIGVSTQMISNLELGKKAIRPENLINICAVLNISADYVLSGSESNSLVDEVYEKLNNLSSDELNFINQMIDYINKRKQTGL